MLTILIHQAFASMDEPGGTRHYELARRLVSQGQQFTIVASEVSYHTGKRVGAGSGLVTESLEDGIRVLRVSSYAPVNTTYFLRVVSFLTFMITSVMVGVSAGKPDVIMGTTPPIFQAISAWLLSALRRRPLLLEIRDLWPEFAIDIGLLKNPALIRIARWLENFLYRRADYLLVNSPAYRDYLIAKGIAPSKISFIPNGVDAEMFDPSDRATALRQTLHLEGKFVAAYAGAIGMANDLDTVIAAADLLRDRKEIHILIVGDGKERKRLESEAARLRLDNLTFTGSFPKSQMRQVLAATDACIAILRNIRMFTTTYPNKVFDYMAAGRPTLLAIDGVIREVVERANGGIFVQPGDPRSLANAIIRLADDPNGAREMGANARQYVIEHFSRDIHAQQFAELIGRVAIPVRS